MVVGVVGEPGLPGTKPANQTTGIKNFENKKEPINTSVIFDPVKPGE